MKTKLLAFILFISFDLFAQIPPGYGGLVTIDITQTTARLRFGVRPNGATSTVRTRLSLLPDVSSFTESNNIIVNTIPFSNEFQTFFVDVTDLTPNTTYYWRVWGTNSFGNALSGIVSFTTLANPTIAPSITLAENVPQITSCVINYNINANLGSTTSLIRYGTDQNNLNLTQVGFGAVPSDTNATGLVNLTGLLAQTTYYYRVEATNSAGTSISPIMSFSTLSANTILPIAHYTFNNTFANTNGSNPFGSVPGAVLSTDRFGKPNKAINLIDTESVATIPGLPYGNAPVTVSIWVRFNIVRPNSNAIYYYGANPNPNAAFVSNSQIHRYSDTAHSIVFFPTANIWYHFTFVYDGTDSKIFRDGVLLGTLPRSWNTINGNDLFRLGSPFSNAPVNNNIWASYDDLQIFDFALTNAQVTALYNQNTLTVNLPSIISLNAIPTITSSTITYAVNANGGATNTLIRYGTSESNLSLTQSGFTANGTEIISDNIVLNNLTPNTTYFYRVEATNSAGLTVSEIRSFTTGQAIAPTIISTSATPGIYSAQLNYTINPNFLTTSVLVKYGMSSNNLNLIVNGSNLTGGTNTNGNVSISGLQPNTTYFYQVDAANNEGLVSSSIESFSTNSLNFLFNYTFDNTHSNTNGQNPFSAANTQFIDDRNNNPNSALRITSTSSNSNAIISNLPTGNSHRTISLWYRSGSFSSGFAGIFVYGGNASLQNFGAYIAANGNHYFQAFGTDANFGGTFPQSVWRHLVLTYDGITVRMYLNGTLQGSQNYNLSTGNTLGFRLGGNGAVIDVDDLLGFNYAMTQAEVVSFYNNYTLSKSEIEVDWKVAIYPNPTNNIFEIKADSEILKVEVYNLSGQLVYQSNTLKNNIGHLNAGMYLVKVTDVNNHQTNQKLIKR
jgi:hypothetical protein